MGKFRITYDLRGPSGILRNIPNKPEIVEVKDLWDVLEQFVQARPHFGPVEIIGISVEEVDP